MYKQTWERSGSVIECLTRDREAAGSSLTCVTALWSLNKTNYPSLVLVQPRKTRPYLTERLLMERKESNQTNNQNKQTIFSELFISTRSYYTAYVNVEKMFELVLKETKSATMNIFRKFLFSF